MGAPSAACFAADCVDRNAFSAPTRLIGSHRHPPILASREVSTSPRLCIRRGPFNRQVTRCLGSRLSASASKCDEGYSITLSVPSDRWVLSRWSFNADSAFGPHAHQTCVVPLQHG